MVGIFGPEGTQRGAIAVRDASKWALGSLFGVLDSLEYQYQSSNASTLFLKWVLFGLSHRG